MFVPSCWARGFVDAAGEDAEAALEFVRIMGPALVSVPGQLAGTAAARRLGRLFHGVFAALPAGAAVPEDRPRELALGFVLLLVKKNLLRHTCRIIDAIEEELDERRGVLRAHVEFAGEPDGEFLNQLKDSLMKKTGAAGIRLTAEAVPELLAGCRLRIGSDSIDASLQTRLKQLGAELAKTYVEAP
jgi:hypothetical protein